LSSDSFISLYLKSLMAPKTKLSPFHNHSFNIAISLGQNCTPRFHIDRIQKSRYFHKYKAHSAYFDSLARDAGHACIADLILSNFSLKAEDFDLKMLDSIWRAYVPKYGTYFIHDFKFSSNDPAKCRVEMNAQRNKTIAKYQYLSEKFLKLLKTDLRIIFVLCDATQLKLSTADSICVALRTINPNLDFKILHLAYNNENCHRIGHPDYISLDFDNTSDTWVGNTSSYDAAFSNIWIGNDV
jgi:hypothetical protein